MTPKASIIIEAIVLVITCTTSILGNITLFLIIARRKTLRTISNGCIFSLAVADLLMSVVVTVIKERWIFGDKACRLLGFTTMLSFVSSVMWLAMIAINRYFYVVQWKSYRSIFTPKQAILFAGIVWLMSLSLSLPPLFGWAEYDYIPGKSYCFVFWTSNVYYMFFMLTICFVGPLTVMCLSYYKILKFTREFKKRVAQHREIRVKAIREFQRIQGNNISLFERNRKLFRMEIKITNTLLIVVACFMTCWASFDIIIFIDVYYPHPLPRAIDIGTLLLGYANSMCNPIVYGIRTQAFRSELNSLFSSCLENCSVIVPNSFQLSSAVASSGDTQETPETLDASRLSKHNHPMD